MCIRDRIFADKACAKGLINLDIAYYKGMFSGLKDLMQTVGTDWKIADLAPSCLLYTSRCV